MQHRKTSTARLSSASLAGLDKLGAPRQSEEPHWLRKARPVRPITRGGDSSAKDNGGTSEGVVNRPSAEEIPTNQFRGACG